MTATLERQSSVNGTTMLTLPDGRTVPVRSAPPSERRRQFLRFVGKHALLIAVSAMFMVPVAFVVLTSLMTDQEALSTTMWPSHFEWGNYAQVFAAVPFLRWTANTFIIAFLSTIGTVVSSVPPAYALSRMRWRGRTVTFWFIIATMSRPDLGRPARLPRPSRFLRSASRTARLSSTRSISPRTATCSSVAAIP